MPLRDSGINPGTESSDPARELQDAVRRGESFSGNERHVVFQNRAGTYQDISGITGLDLPEDGRAACFTDWDHDGDLDLWLSNRSAPQVRFFQNNNPSGGASLSLKLIGKTTNRDAIGTRAVLKVKGQPSQTKFVSAGSGFLAQSSKTLHFGLGSDGATIESLTLHWLGDAEPQVLSALKPGRYQVTQGSPPVALKPSKPNTFADQVAPTPLRRTILAAPLPVATLLPRPADKAGQILVFSAAEAGAVSQILYDHPFDIKGRALDAAPFFLVDGNDHLRVIYHATPTPKQIEADLALVSEDPLSRRAASLPFPGLWQSQSTPTARPLSLAEDLIDANLLELATRYIDHYRALLETDDVFPQLLARLQGAIKDETSD